VADLLLSESVSLEQCPWTDLARTLSDEHVVIYGVELDPSTAADPLAVVVGPTGVVLLDDGGGEAEAALPLLRVFFQETLPKARIPVRAVATGEQVDLEFGVMGGSTSAIAYRGKARRRTLDAELRELIIRVLCDPPVPVNRRAKTPFVFRTAGLLGGSGKAWTIAQAIRIIARNPQVGIHHLQNGTLAHWLEAQGADDLAELARDVARQAPQDTREMLETFLIGTGLVPRPQMAVSASRLDFGHLVPGEVVTRRLRIRGRRVYDWLTRRWGHGYLTGKLETSNQWVRLSQDSFREAAEIAITLDTKGLRVTDKPSKAELRIHSNADDHPLIIPITNHVHAMPSTLVRRVLRPLISALIACTLGSLLGYMLARAGMHIPAFIQAWCGAAVTPVRFWMVTAGALWLVLGAVRGWAQRPGWPMGYALRHWLLRTAFWAVVLGLCAVLLMPALARPWAGLETIPHGIRWPLFSLACVLAILPGTIGELAAARIGQETGQWDLDTDARVRRKRQLWYGAVGLAVSALLFVGVSAAASDEASLRRITQPLEQAVGTVEGSMNEIVNRIYLNVYDRRAR